MRATAAANEAQRKADLTGNVHVFYEAIGSLLPGMYVSEAAPGLNGLKVRKAVAFVTDGGMIMDAVAVPPEKEMTACSQETFDYVRDTHADLKDQLEYLRSVVEKDRGSARKGEAALLDKLCEACDMLSGIESHIRKHACEELTVRSESLKAKAR
jgi:hypothetical protein